MQNKIAFISDNFSRYQNLLRKHSPENLIIDLLTFSEAEGRSLAKIFFNLYIIDASCISKTLPDWLVEIAKQDYFFRVILISDEPPKQKLLNIFSDRLYAIINHEQAETSLSQFIENAWQSTLKRQYNQKVVY